MIGHRDPLGSFGPGPSTRGERWALALLLGATFAIRAIHPGQPIVENYVGRQIPTAMVARNLQRGSGFLHPELDTGPFPNRFLVEPPIYAQVVATTSSLLHFPLEPTGRLVSAAATALAAWGLFGLARRREGPSLALLAVAAFAAFPVMIRYGRAFQPDALMLGTLLAGLRCWDEREAGGGRAWAWAGWFLLATALALKVIVAWALLPFAAITDRRPLAWRFLVAGMMLVPACSWYLYAWGDVARPTSGSLASSDNVAIWIRSAGPASWVRFSTWSTIGRALVVGSFGPVGFALAAWGWAAGGAVDRFWKAWGVGCGMALLILAAKWHHGYYWMAVAPVAAVGVARGLVALGRLGFVFPGLAGAAFLAGCVWQSAPTWRSPPEWSALPEVARHISPRGMIIAPEAVIYYADCRGFRLEFEPEAAMRAAGEWGATLANPADPLALTDFYRGMGFDEVPAVGEGFPDLMLYPEWAELVADVGPAEVGSRRASWRAAIRGRPGTQILLDRPDAFVAQIR